MVLERDRKRYAVVKWEKHAISKFQYPLLLI
jgi:hypothetical protein